MAINGITGLSDTFIKGFYGEKGLEQNGSITKFSDYMKDAINNVSDLLQKSDSLTNDFAAGKTDNIHQVMIASEKADLSLQMAMQVRNKLLDAYNEIMRMQI